MTFVNKYFANFSSPAYGGTSQEYEIEWLFDGFVGTATEVKVNTVSVSPSDSSDDFVGVKARRLTVEILTESLRGTDFLNVSEKSIKVVLTNVTGSPVTEFVGFVSSENSKDPYEDGNRYLKILHNDGLELLASSLFVDGSDRPFSGKDNIASIFAKCFNKLGLGLGIKTIFDVRQSGDTLNAITPILNNKQLNQSLFVEKNCFEVVKGIAETLNCQVFQEGGFWHIIHPYSIDGSGTFVHTYNSSGVFVSGASFLSSQRVGFDEVLNPLSGGEVVTERPYGKIISTVDMAGADNSLVNGDFQNVTLGVPDGWTSNVDSFSNGGMGTTLDPYYGQINGYQPKNVTDFLTIKKLRLLDDIVLADSSVDSDMEGKLNQRLQLSCKVLGNDVKKAHICVSMVIEHDIPSLDNLFYVLGSSGEWVRIGSNVFNPKLDFLNYCIGIDLVNSEGVNADKYATVKVEATPISQIVGRASGLLGRIFAGLLGDLAQLKKITVDNFTKVKIQVAIYEGLERTIAPKNGTYNEWVRYADLSLGFVDNNITSGAKSIQYTTKLLEETTRNKSLKRLFNTYDDANERSAIYNGSGVVTNTAWITDTIGTGYDLAQLLDIELLQQYRNPLTYFSGNIIGKVARTDLVTLHGYNDKFIPVRVGFDYSEGLSDIHLLKVQPVLTEQFENKKEAVFSDGTKVEMDTEAPDSVIRDAEFRTKDFPGYTDPNYNAFPEWTSFLKTVNIAKIDPDDVLGISFFNAAGDETDYIRKATNGFVFKSEDNPYTATLDFANLTQNVTLQVPNLAINSVIATDATAWMLGATNALTAKDFIGSVSGNFDLGIKRNNVEIVTVKSTGIDVVGRLTAATVAVTGLTTNYLPKVGAAGLLGNSQIFDNGLRVGIGTDSPTLNRKLHVVDTSAIVQIESTGNTFGQVAYKNSLAEYRHGITGATTGVLYTFDATNSQLLHEAIGGGSGFHRFYTNGGERMRIHGSGNVGIGATVDSGDKLNVVGTIRTSSIINQFVKANASGVLTGSAIAIGDVTDLTTQLLGKAATVHTHTVSQITDIDTNYWKFGGNALTAKTLLGSTSAFDLGIIRNNVEIATIKSTGIDIVNNLTILNGQLIGGVGAESTSGVLDWNDVTNSRSGSGFTLLFGSAANGMGGSVLFHPFNFEYISKDGTGNITQLGVPYSNDEAQNAGMYMRGRFSNVWGNWKQILTQRNNATWALTGGNVGIGTTAPTDLLHVNGTTRTTNLKINNGAAVGLVWQCTNADGTGAWVSPLASERYKGEYDANSGVAPAASPTTGDYYVVNNGGTYSGITYVAGDEIYWDGTNWIKRSNFLTLPIATASTLGGIKIGSGLSIDGSGVVTVNTLNQNTTGSAATLTTARNIAATGDIAWNVNFDGSGNVTAVANLPNIATAGTYRSVTVNAKGQVTAGTNPTTIAGYGITDYNSLWDARYDVEHSGLSDPYIPKWTGSGFVNSSIYETSGTVGIGVFGTTNLVVTGNVRVTSDNKIEVGNGSGSYFHDLSGVNDDTKGIVFQENTSINYGFSFRATGGTEVVRIFAAGGVKYTNTLRPNGVLPVTGQFLKATSASANAWANIVIADVTDLTTQLAGKAASVHTHTVNQITDFNTGWDARLATKSTANLTEGTSLYFTNSRARAAISESVTGLDYNNTTGVLSLTNGYLIPTVVNFDNKLNNPNLPNGVIPYLNNNGDMFSSGFSQYIYEWTLAQGGGGAVFAIKGSVVNLTLGLLINDVVGGAGQIYRSGGVGGTAYWSDLSTATLSDWSTAWDAKYNAIVKNTAFNKNFGTVAGTVAEGNHVHTITQVTGLQAALDGKAAISHVHAIADVTGLQATLTNLQNDLSLKWNTSDFQFAISDGNGGVRDLYGLRTKDVDDSFSGFLGFDQTSGALMIESNTFAGVSVHQIAEDGFLYRSFNNNTPERYALLSEVNTGTGGTLQSLQGVTDVGFTTDKRIKFQESITGFYDFALISDTQRLNYRPGNNQPAVSYALVSELPSTPSLQDVINESPRIDNSLIELNNSGLAFYDNNVFKAQIILQNTGTVLGFYADNYLFNANIFNFAPNITPTNGARYAFEWDTSIQGGSFKLVKIN